MELKNKKVLQMGLGILGGGVATARFLVSQGAKLTVTDMKTLEYLKPSIERLEDIKENIIFVLGEHREQDFLDADIIVVNPDVPHDNPFLELARTNGKQIENELTLFYAFCKSKNTFAVTGTRGKTTTVNWIAHVLSSQYVDTKIIGNSPESPFLGSVSLCDVDTNVVLEQPSFQLESLVDSALGKEYKLAPHVAVITNLYRDHLNRHKTMEGYARAKANIFINQEKEDYLILNHDNEWTKFFLELNPKSQVLFFSLEKLPIDFNGIYIENEEIKIRLQGVESTLIKSRDFILEWGEHNMQNFLIASLVALLSGVSKEKIIDSISTLPQIKFRQEKVYKNGKIEIYNDTAGTSPEATIAILNRFKNQNKNIILIAGGTDRDLDFKQWAKVVATVVKKENLILLGGSATEKMKKELGFSGFNEYESLDECFAKAYDLAIADESDSVILFSPGCKSFEKFKNEFDRGGKFNALVESIKSKEGHM